MTAPEAAGQRFIAAGDFLWMEDIARTLRSGNDSVARIAESSGYESEAAFNRAFKREFGVPPAAWRRAG